MTAETKLDPKLVATARALMLAKSDVEAIEQALEEAIEARTAGYAGLMSLRGKVEWVGDLEAMRRDD